MSLLETLVLTIGAEIGKNLLLIWLKEQKFLEITSGTSIELLTAKLGDVLSARRAARQFDNLGDRIARNLEPLFRSSNLQENSFIAVAKEVATAISTSKISVQLLADINYNPQRLVEFINAQHPAGSSLFSEAETSLYNRVLDHSAQYIVDLAPNLPSYTSFNFIQILERLDLHMQKTEQIVDDLEKLRLTSETGDTGGKSADFERDYRALIIRKFDRLDLFGADLSRRSKRYQLSIAYVSLNLYDVSISDDDFEYASGTLQQTNVQNALSYSVDQKVNDKDKEDNVRFSRTAIIGDAGSGKTTLLYWLAVHSAANTFDAGMSQWHDTLPFIIELRRYGEDLPPPERFLEKTAFEIAARMPNNWVHDILESGRAALLIDGLDEVPEAHRDRVYEWLENLCIVFRKCRIVFTSRPSSYKLGTMLDLGFREYELAPMELNQVQVFIDHWHRSVLGDHELISDKLISIISKQLFFKVRNSAPLSKLASNPLLCAMLCALHHERNMQLPSDRSELYESCCSMLLDRRDSERAIDTQHHPRLTYKQKRVILDDLAYWMMKNKYVSAKKWQAFPRVKEKLKNIHLAQVYSDDAVISYLVERSGIIRDPTPDSIDFIHRTFQEYMAASAASVEEDWGFLLDKASDDQWQETIVLAAGYSNKQQADCFLRSLLDMGSSSNVHSHKYDLLAISCLETIVEISPDVRDEVEKRLNSLIPPKSRDSIKTLAAAGERAVPFLKAMRLYTPRQSLACVQALLLIGTEAAFTQALEYLGRVNSKVDNEIYGFMDLISSEHISASNIERLIEFMSDSVSSNCLSVHWNVLALFEVTPNLSLSDRIKSVVLRLSVFFGSYSRDSSLSILTQFHDAEGIYLDGYAGDLSILSKIPNLQELEIRRYSPLPWPDFESIPKIQKLRSLKLSSFHSRSDQIDATPQVFDSWPNLAFLSTVKNLSRLSILADDPDLVDFQIIESISQVQGLRYLHIAALFPLSIDLEPLGSLKKLERLELSSSSSIESVLGLGVVSTRDLIFNVFDAGNDLLAMQEGVKVFCPNCNFQINYNWTMDKW
jgi:hypothetical protein